MDKTEIKTKVTTETIHSFYCDNCGRFIGSTQEYDDGWYKELGEFILKFYMPSKGWYVFNKCFCDKCQQSYLKQLENNLVELGFVSECD